MAHNALRGELAMVREALTVIQMRGEGLKEWEIKAIQTVFEAHAIHVTAYNASEDEILVPECRKRFHFPEKLLSDHEGIAKKLEKVKIIVTGLQPGDKVDKLLKAWKDYESFMLPHLLEEEVIGLPLLRAYFTPEETYEHVVKRINACAPKYEMGSVIYFTGPNAYRTEVMVQEGIPCYVWYTDLYPKYKAFVKDVVHNIDALTTGEEPLPECQVCNIL